VVNSEEDRAARALARAVKEWVDANPAIRAGLENAWNGPGAKLDEALRSYEAARAEATARR